MPSWRQGGVSLLELTVAALLGIGLLSMLNSLTLVTLQQTSTLKQKLFNQVDKLTLQQLWQQRWNNLGHDRCVHWQEELPLIDSRPLSSQRTLPLHKQAWKMQSNDFIGWTGQALHTPLALNSAAGELLLAAAKPKITVGDTFSLSDCHTIQFLEVREVVRNQRGQAIHWQGELAPQLLLAIDSGQTLLATRWQWQHWFVAQASLPDDSVLTHKGLMAQNSPTGPRQELLRGVEGFACQVHSLFKALRCQVKLTRGEAIPIWLAI